MVYAICFAAVSVLFRIIFRFETHNTEVFDEYKKNGRPFIICANHLSMIDPVFVVMAYGIGKKLSIMGKAELFKNPFLNWIFRQVGCFPVERGKADKSALEKGISDIKNGHGMLIFPEGTRGTGDKMQKIKSGAFMIAAQTGADIIPVRIVYPTKTRKLQPLCKVVISVGKPMTAEETDLASGSRAAIREAKKNFETELERLLSEYNESVGYVPPIEATAENPRTDTESEGE